MFFSRYYGSTNGRFPQRTFSSDDRARFEARLTAFCHAVDRPLADHNETAKRAAPSTCGPTARAGGHIYVVQPLGPFEDDPNVTNKRFPGNPTESYRRGPQSGSHHDGDE